MPYSIASKPPIAYSVAPAAPKKTVDAPKAPVAVSMDLVTISREALEKASLERQANQAAEEKDQTPSWDLLGGLTNGTKTLKNGHRQVVKIDGSSLAIQEYDSDRLVKSVTGEIDGSLVSLDTEIYDKTGDVSQTIHTELQGLGTKDDMTLAEMSRDIEWFDGGKLTRRMHDDMRLASSYKGGVDPNIFLPSNLLAEATKPQPTDYEAFDWALSGDTHRSHYSATIEEYTGGKLMRETTISQKALHENETNRTAHRINGQEPRTTKEISHDVNLSISTIQYDGQGNVVRQAAFTDEQVDGAGAEGGITTQNISVSWYNDGELLQRSSGSLALAETKQTKLSSRPDLLEVLGLDEEQYVSKKPQTAEELLSNNVLETATQGEGLGTATRRHAGAGDYSAAEKIAKYGVHDQPYSIVWSDELYKDGELAARRENKEAAVLNPLAGRFNFHTAGALTEDQTELTLARTEHVGERYENGHLRERQFSKYREYVDEVDKGADGIATAAQKGELSHGRTESSANDMKSPLGELDNRAKSASVEMSTQVELTLEDFLGTMRSVRGDTMKKNQAEQLIRYKPA